MLFSFTLLSPLTILLFVRFLHHEDEFPIERLDVNTTGEIVASISHDNRFDTLANDDYAVIDLHLA
jgi:hypothetical protein